MFIDFSVNIKLFLTREYINVVIIV